MMRPPRILRSKLIHHALGLRWCQTFSYLILVALRCIFINFHSVYLHVAIRLVSFSKTILCRSPRNHFFFLSRLSLLLTATGILRV